MKPKTLFAFTILSEEPESRADTPEKGRTTPKSGGATRTAALDVIKNFYSFAETYAADQTGPAADFRFVQLDSEASETYLQ